MVSSGESSLASGETTVIRSQHQDDDENNLGAIITGALNSKPANAMAEIIRTHCPSVFLALKSAIAAEVSTACQKLCRRSQGSVLYGNSYESLKEFSFDSIWNEIETNIPFMIQIMSAVSAKNSANITVDLRVKYGFIYSIPMSERWHELSALKRVNTVLVLEGGCTNQVRELAFLLSRYFSKTKYL